MSLGVGAWQLSGETVYVLNLGVVTVDACHLMKANFNIYLWHGLSGGHEVRMSNGCHWGDMYNKWIRLAHWGQCSQIQKCDVLSKVR